MYTKPVDEQVSFETPEDRAHASERQSYVLGRYVEVASERDEGLAAFAAEEKRATDGVAKGREARSRQAGWAGRLGCYTWWLRQYKKLKDATEKDPKNRDIATSGAEFIVKPANHPTKWLSDDEIAQTMLDADLSDETMDECFILTVTVPVAEGQINDVRNALTEVGLGITVTRTPNKVAIKRYLDEDGRTFQVADAEDGVLIDDAKFGRRVMWRDPPSVPDTYQVIAPDGRVFAHNPLDDPEPEPESEGTEGEEQEAESIWDKHPSRSVTQCIRKSADAE